jgi:hypothetical protein
LEAALIDNFGSHKFVNTDSYPMSLKTSINHLPPERMTPEQRRLEIASILVKGLVRLRKSNQTERQIPATERKVLLGFSGDQSVHTDLINK